MRRQKPSGLTCSPWQRQLTPSISHGSNSNGPIPSIEFEFRATASFGASPRSSYSFGKSMRRLKLRGKTAVDKFPRDRFPRPWLPSNDSVTFISLGPGLISAVALPSNEHNQFMSIYVEILIRTSMEELWEKTQEPKLHQRWDLRFSEIDYQPRDPGEAQKFTYVTQIGAGVKIEGSGESTGEHNDSNGQRSSALKFWSDDPKSLIGTGSGYWKYIPAGDGIRFITWYDYRTRFGILGEIADKLLFRPLMGWATAWSFDRLRLWIEKGITPEASREKTIAHAISRLTIAFVWFYHGLVPKLINRNTDEIKMLRDAGIANSELIRAVSLLGFLEICLALTMAIFWKSRWPLWFTIVAMLLATLGVAIISPNYLTAAFNPLTLNVSVAALAVLSLLDGRSLPSATNCLRKSPEGER